MMTRCDLHTHRECACPVGRCHQQPQTPAPVATPSIRFSLGVIGFGVAMMAIAFASLSAADRQFHRQTLENQENVRHG
jgi:hypothetical protein